MSAINAGLDEDFFDNLENATLKIPFYNYIGFELLLLAPGYAEFQVACVPHLANGIGLGHGGLMISIADASMGTAVRTLGIKAVTVDISTSLLTSAKVGDTLVTKAKVLKAGKNMVFAEAKVYVGDKLIGDSKASFHTLTDAN